MEYGPEKKIGILLPFKDISLGVFESSYTTTQQAKSNLYNLLLTMKGERYMQPEFGTNLYKKIFEQDTEDLREDIIMEITNAIETWLPYIIIQNIDIFYANEDDYRNHAITIKLDYSLSINNSFTDSITFKLNKIA